MKGTTTKERGFFTRWTPTIDRFWAQVERGGDADCWPWIGYREPAGYGQIGVNGRTYRAHRYAYETFVGPIPEGLVLDHLCGNPPCVNPDHLEPVAQAVNVHRGRLTRMSAAEVEAIRMADGTQAEIARRFGVSQSYVSLVKSGQRRPEREAA